MQRVSFSSLCLGASLLLSSATALAQNAPAPMPANNQTRQADSQPAIGSTTFTSVSGAKVIIKSKPEPLPHSGPAPSFASLAGTSGHFITRAQASAYPLLANDFEHADLNRDGRISKAEYAHWKAH